MPGTDTIAALATPPGRGGIGIVRISGPGVRAIAASLLGRLPRPRYAAYGAFRDADGRPLDAGLALFFPAPHSYTGEDMLELHAHGSPIVLDMLLRRVLELGARPARPGEFSERAFLNDKLDLAQAEAVADLIDAASEAAARSAMRSLDGEFSRRVHELVERLTRLRMHIEAAIDFTEEEIDFLADEHIAREIDALHAATVALAAAAHQGRLLSEGMTVVLAGPPNAGKSSLLNALAREDAAIVSPIPGTTRDVLRARVSLDGMPLEVVDTAGLRAQPDEIEAEGIRRARAAMARADRLLLVVDDAAPDPQALAEAAAQLPARPPRTVIRNKIDLTGRAPALRAAEDGTTEVLLSVKTGAGLDLLYAHLKQCMGFQPAGEGTFSARRRHLEAIGRAQQRLAAARDHARSRAGELAAEELRLAQQALAEITGEFAPEDLLARIFATFCIGK